MRRARPQPYCRHASAPGARADASGKLSNLIADMPPHPERVRMRRASSPTLLPTCPDPGAHADAPPKAPFPTMFRQPPPAARPDENFRQDGSPGQESRVALPVPSKRPALMKAGPFARQRASIRRQSPHACGHSREVRVAGDGLPAPPNNTRPALVQAGSVSCQRASIRRQSPHACGHSHGVHAARAGFPAPIKNNPSPHRPAKQHTPCPRESGAGVTPESARSSAKPHACGHSRDDCAAGTGLPDPPNSTHPAPVKEGPFARRRAVI